MDNHDGEDVPEHAPEQVAADVDVVVDEEGQLGAAGGEALADIDEEEDGAYGTDTDEEGPYRRVMSRQILNYGRGRTSSSSDDDETVTYSEVVSQYNTRGNVYFAFCNIKSHVAYPGDDLEMLIREHCKVSLVPGATYELHRQIKVVSPIYLIGNNANLVVSTQMASAILIEARMNQAPVMLMGRNVVMGLSMSVKPGVKCKYLLKTNIPGLLSGCKMRNSTGWCVRADMGFEVAGCKFEGSYGAVMTPNTCCTLMCKSCVFKGCLFGVNAFSKVEVKNSTFIENACSFLVRGTGSLRGCDFLGCMSGQSVCLCNPHRTQLCNVYIAPGRKHYPRMTECKFVNSQIMVSDRPMSTLFSQCVFMNSCIYVDDNSFAKLQLPYSVECNVRVKRVVVTVDEEEQNMRCVCGMQHVCAVLKSSDVTRRAMPDRSVFSVDMYTFSSDEE